MGAVGRFLALLSPGEHAAWPAGLFPCRFLALLSPGEHATWPAALFPSRLLSLLSPGERATWPAALFPGRFYHFYIVFWGLGMVSGMVFRSGDGFGDGFSKPVLRSVFYQKYI